MAGDCLRKQKNIVLLKQSLGTSHVTQLHEQAITLRPVSPVPQSLAKAVLTQVYPATGTMPPRAAGCVSVIVSVIWDVLALV